MQMSLSGDESAEEIMKKQLKLANPNLPASSSDDDGSSTFSRKTGGKQSQRKQKQMQKFKQKTKKGFEQQTQPGIGGGPGGLNPPPLP